MMISLVIIAFILNHPFYTILIIFATSSIIALPEILEELL